ncbi:RagB/SusD family nutrient uptake outer membrane protein [Hufsiella ginkgonis]|uniref:RagB/SusD family nutrient uptake outer membrane protein n=1 Tax=Hufsiella ginkgonis TaxID=2695274 RepID=A0A7K1Y1W9_9SPHI|nr:RagB/SusD family nutrient uptake outer membrane protein [Hufsiella ginkgonis]MXV17235.1 RagB/SusD family nutrient uptake outer membrane protein [Hufsiella ginkgonis]
MKHSIIKLASVAFLVMGAYACKKLDVAPPNILTDEVVLSTPEGIKAYMASLYGRLPIEDFKYSATDNTFGYRGFNTWNTINSLSVNTGENANRNSGGFQNPAQGWWSDGYSVIRYANNLIEQLPKQPALTPANVKRWVGEAYFMRAYTYFALAKRYGGVPLVKNMQQYTGSNGDQLFVQRSSEDESFDLIRADLDSAINRLGETSENPGRANKYVAAAFKSRAMLYAGSVARYGIPVSVNGVMVNGIPAAKANDYFKEAYTAAKMLEGKYSLYMKSWSATDKTAAANNFANLFLDAGSPENIFTKGYSFPDAVHSWDHLYNPTHMTQSGGDRYCPTLDFVEMFDGLNKNAKGQLVTTNASGAYLVYNSAAEAFSNAEPRLRGSVLFSGSKHKGATVDIRRGIFVETIDPATPVQKFFPDESKLAYSTLAFYKDNVKESAQANASGQTVYKLSNGVQLYPSGLDGVSSAKGYASVTGFQGRKYLLPDLAISNTNIHQSTQPWIELRYAEVLLNRAEAALELFQNNGTVPGAADLQQDAFECMNLVRNRAGAQLLASKADLSSGAALTLAAGGYAVAPNRAQQLIRVERKKELAMENKTYWDLKRWRTFDQEVNARIWRVCMPFLFAKGATAVAADDVQGKWALDCRYDERGSAFTFPVRNYYEPIPGTEITKGLYGNPGLN